MSKRLADLRAQDSARLLPVCNLDDDLDDIVAYFDIAGFKSIGLHLALHQITARNFQLLFCRVARKLMVSMRSRRGPGTVSSIFAVVRNTTR